MDKNAENVKLHSKGCDEHLTKHAFIRASGLSCRAKFFCSALFIALISLKSILYSTSNTLGNDVIPQVAIVEENNIDKAPPAPEAPIPVLKTRLPKSPLDADPVENDTSPLTPIPASAQLIPKLTPTDPELLAVPAPGEISMPPSDIRVERGRIHSSFPLECRQIPQETSQALTNIIDIYTNDRARVPEHSLRSTNSSHLRNEGTYLMEWQVCIYDALNKWNQLSERLGITNWAAHGGTLMGAKCFGALSPWDDDIDITVLNCNALDDLYEKSDSNISHYYPDLDPKSHTSGTVLEGRLIMKENLILIKFALKQFKWYKLMTVKQAYLWVYPQIIMGMDIECVSRAISPAEQITQRRSGFRESMIKKDIHTVPFGPTTIKVVPPKIADRYIKLRYGKESSCQFPFGNGVKPEPLLLRQSDEYDSTNVFQQDQRQADMSFALEHWYIPSSKRKQWKKQAGSKRQTELTAQIQNLDKVEIDNTISPGCTWGQNSTLKVIGWNAERGTYWDRFYNLTQVQDSLSKPLVILMNEMDIGMARSGNVHTARRLALQLGMNYAYGVEFLELTRGTEEEQKATRGDRDALSLHGNAILSKCILGDAMILRDPLPHTYFSDRAHRGINANGFEIRLGGRMGLFARIFQTHSALIISEKSTPESERYSNLDKLPPHFVVGNVHKVKETDRTRAFLWDYFGFGPPPINSTSKYDGNGINLPSSQLGVIIQGDYGPKFCSLGGLSMMNNLKKDKTFRVKCLPNSKASIRPLSADYFCSNMKSVSPVKVTASCDWRNNSNPITLADHAIVSIVVQGKIAQ